MIALLLAAAPPATVEARFGVCLHLNDSTPAEFPAVRATGFGAIRTDLTWGEVERSRGQYTWGKFDAAVGRMRALGIHPLLILFDYNKNYGDGAPRSPEARAAFAKFCGLAAARYRSAGADFEIWNEPNTKLFWRPGPNAEEYVALVKAASAAIRAVNPKARILGGSVTEPMIPYLEQCFNLGMLDAVDAVSIHPYRPQRPESLLATASRLRALIAVFAKGRKIGLEITEMGYPLTYPGQDEARQARYLTRAFLSSLVAGFDHFYLYQWRDQSFPGETQGGYGVNDERLSPKPLRAAVRHLGEALAGFAYSRRLPSESPEDFVLEFTRGSQRRVVAWSARRDPADPESVSRNPGLLPQPITPRATVGGRRVMLSGTPQVFEP